MAEVAECRGPKPSSRYPDDSQLLHGGRIGNTGTLSIFNTTVPVGTAEFLNPSITSAAIKPSDTPVGSNPGDLSSSLAPKETSAATLSESQEGLRHLMLQMMRHSEASSKALSQDITAQVALVQASVEKLRQECNDCRIECGNRWQLADTRISQLEEKDSRHEKSFSKIIAPIG